MRPIVSAGEMRAIDEETIRDHVSGLTLMERAGKAVRDHVVSRWLAGQSEQAVTRPKKGGQARRTQVKKARVLVVCGKGNNGGDGMVVARLLKRDGWPVALYLAGKPSEVKGDALTNLKRCARASLKARRLAADTWEEFLADLGRAEVVVDAVFGTGFEGEPRGLAAEVIEAINRRGSTGGAVVAVDIPSGVNATTGGASLAVQATSTITMGLPKRGHLFFPGKALTGELVVADIGIPAEVVERARVAVMLPGRGDVKAAMPVRSPDAHKGSCGHVACICGSTGLTGAAALASLSALRAGAGLVTLAVPRSLNAIMETKLTEVMTLPVEETAQGSFSVHALGALQDLVGRADCVALGPGLSRNPETAELVRALVPALGKPCVLDADGINAFAGHADLLGSGGAPLVVTPHVGEAARLFGVDKAEIAAGRIEFAREAARRLGVVLVLKGAPTVVAGPEGEVFVNPTGNCVLATAGSGDVLTGLIAGLLAQGAPALEAAWLGAYVHGWCGDIMLFTCGGVGFLAGEISRQIPHAITALTHSGPRWDVLRRMGPS
ncbi:MAG: NAD(P)H-hydrate dehydratase [bacterium]